MPPGVGWSKKLKPPGKPGDMLTWTLLVCKGKASRNLGYDSTKGYPLVTDSLDETTAARTTWEG